MVEGLEGYSYEDRFEDLGAYYSRDKILAGWLDSKSSRYWGGLRIWIQIGFPFQVVGDGVRRGHSFKLFKKRYRLDVGESFHNNMLAGFVRSAEQVGAMELSLQGQWMFLRRGLIITWAPRTLTGLPINLIKRMLFPLPNGHANWRYLHGLDPW